MITAKQIEEQVVTNVADLFRYEPGVTVLGGQGDAQTFIIRGMGKTGSRWCATVCARTMPTARAGLARATLIPT